MENVPQYSVHDFVLAVEPPGDGNPFLSRVTASFEHESGLKITDVPGFYDGGDRYIVRFAPNRPGKWTGVVSSDRPALDGRELDAVECVAAETCAVRGVIGIDPRNSRRLAWEDGTPFVLLGFECDWLFSYHQRNPDDCARRLDRLLERGFNCIVMNIYAHTGFSRAEHRPDDERPSCEECIYGPPDMYVFGGTNEEPDHSRLNVDFFRDYDAMMALLHERGIVAHIMIQVQNKKVNWPARRSVEDDLYWSYVVARYQAFGNVVWDIGKECFYFFKETGGHDYTLDRIELVRRNDAYHHLVTAHDPAGHGPGTVCEVDEACDFVSDQIHVGDCGVYNREAIAKQRALPQPYLNIEYGYEEGAEQLKTYRGGTTAEWQSVLKWTWSIYAAGAYACYYYCNTAWDLVKFDPEPEGWARYAHLRRFLSSLPFNGMAPANDMVDRGFCLASPGDTYFVFLCDGGDVELDLSAVPGRADERSETRWDGVTVGALWLDIFTGEEIEQEVTPAGFRTRFENPLPRRDTPCAVRVGC